MKSKDEIKAGAIKLRGLLDARGLQLKHSESLEVISRLEGYSDWNTHVADITARQQIAEQYVDKILEAYAELSYAKVTRLIEKEELEDLTEKEFLRVTKDLHEDVGSYVSREYMGSIEGAPFNEPVDKFPEASQHVWRGKFEKHTVLIIIGIYIKDGIRYIGDVSFT